MNLKKYVYGLFVCLISVLISAAPYVDVPASRLLLKVRKVIINCDNNGTPSSGVVEWEYETALGNVYGQERVSKTELLTLWNLSRQGLNLDQITDSVIDTIAQKKGVEVEGSVSNVVPYLVTEINTYTNYIYSDFTSNQLEDVIIVVQTNTYFKFF
jgi:hypothetical protein